MIKLKVLSLGNNNYTYMDVNIFNIRYIEPGEAKGTYYVCFSKTDKLLVDSDSYQRVKQVDDLNK